MGETVLVFPAGMPEGLEYRDRARARGLRVVGASSVEADPAEGSYEAWERLPYVNDPGFDDVRRKAMSVVKKRTGQHEDTIRELSVAQGRGLVVGEALSQFSGVLTSVPQYHGEASELDRR